MQYHGRMKMTSPRGEMATGGGAAGTAQRAALRGLPAGVRYTHTPDITHTHTRLTLTPRLPPQCPITTSLCHPGGTQNGQQRSR